MQITNEFAWYWITKETGEDSQIIGESKARVWVERNVEFVNLGLKGQGHREVKGLGFSLSSNDAIKGIFCLFRQVSLGVLSKRKSVIRS